MRSNGSVSEGCEGMEKVWAFDLGASNGRLMVSGFDGKRLYLEEVHRFFNRPIYATGHYYWDILRIFQEMKNGIGKVFKTVISRSKVYLSIRGALISTLSATGNCLAILILIEIRIQMIV